MAKFSLSFESLEIIFNTHHKSQNMRAFDLKVVFDIIQAAEYGSGAPKVEKNCSNNACRTCPSIRYFTPHAATL